MIKPQIKDQIKPQIKIKEQGGIKTSTFGTPIATVAPVSGFSFGSNPASLGSAGTLFSTASLSGVTPSATTMAGGSTGGFFGGLSSAAPLTTGLTFGGLGSGGFGLTTQQPSTIGLGFSQPGAFGGGLTGAATTASSTGLGLFGSTVPTTASSLGGFGTGAQTITTPSMGLGGGFFGSSNVTAPNQSFGSAPIAVPAVTGLGGIGVSQSTVGGSNEAKNDSKTVKEFPVPPEIITLTQDFKRYIQEQKVVREDISRTSSTQLMKVQEEIGNHKQLLSVVSNGIQRNLAAIKKLKQETAQELKHAEIMQRTKDIPLALQYENTAPMEYFRWLICEFESKMQTYRQQINMMERHLELVTHSSVVTSQELTLTLKKFHETLIFLAAELHTINEKMAAQKEHFLMYRRLVHQDSSNIFSSVGKGKSVISARPMGIPVTVGPSPFGTQSVTTMALATALEKAQQPSGAPPTYGLASSTFGSQVGFPSGFGGTSTFGAPQFRSGSNICSMLPLKPQGPSTSGFYTPATPATPATTPVFGVAANKTFQLQKPPVGNKRGKR